VSAGGFEKASGNALDALNAGNTIINGSSSGSGLSFGRDEQTSEQTANPNAQERPNESGSRKSGRSKKKRGVWPVTYKWLAMGTLVAYTAIGSQKVASATPQQQKQGAASPTQTADRSPQKTLPRMKFDIPAGVLGDALDAYQKQTGVQVEVSKPGIRGLASPGVSGLYTNEEALQHLLSGTGVSYEFSTPVSVSLDLASVEESVTVSADALNPEREEVDSPKYTEPILDTPQSINVVPQKVMSEQNTTTLRDALRNVAGISLAAGEGSSQGDNLTIRGFTARNDIFLDGMRDFGSCYRDTFNQEEVQVLEGPSAITFGRGTTGGVVNDVSKEPGMTSFIRGNATGGSDLTRRIALDVNEALPHVGSGTAFRLNVMGDDNKVADRDVGEYRRFGFAPSLSIGLGTATRATFSYFHQSENDTPDYGIPWLLNTAADVPRHNYYGFRDANFLNTNDDIFTASVEHDLDHGITLRNVVRYANEGRNAQITEPQTTTCPVPPLAPTAGCAMLGTPLTSIIVKRNEINVDSVEAMLDDQMDATFHFNTGLIRHTLAAGLEGVRETSDPRRNTITGVPTTSLLNPNESQPYAGTSVPNTRVNVTTLTLGVYALDTLHVGNKFDFIVGGRWDDFDADYKQFVGTPTAFTQVIGLASWRGAVVYKPTTNGSIYFDAGNSYDPSAETLSLSALTANTPPEKNLTIEGGTKWDLASGKLSASGSVFRTDKTNAREPDPDNPLLDVLGGHERVNGFQVSVAGHLTDRWELLSSYALLDSYVVSSQYYPQSVGVELANVPRNTFNFWSTYKLPWKKVGVGGGGNFVDKRTASSTVPFVTIPTGVGSQTVSLLKEVPGYWVFNAMVNVPLSERTSLQVNLNNLTNRYYYDQVHPAHIVPGAGFTALAGINFRF
jgi:catecholate siderophore receptor